MNYFSDESRFWKTLRNLYVLISNEVCMIEIKIRMSSSTYPDMYSEATTSKF